MEHCFVKVYRVHMSSTCNGFNIHEVKLMMYVSNNIDLDLPSSGLDITFMMQHITKDLIAIDS